MGEFVSNQNVPRNELLRAITSGRYEVVEAMLEGYEGGLDESILAAAEATKNVDIVVAVLDCALCEGWESDHNCPTQIHRVIELGFPMSAKYLAELIVDGDRVKRYQGMTPREFAADRGMLEVADILA